MEKEIVGHVVFYMRGENNQPSGFDAGAFVPKKKHQISVTVLAMMSARPTDIVVIEPVVRVPEWAQN